MVTKQERITQLEGIAALLIEMANGTEFDLPKTVTTGTSFYNVRLRNAEWAIQDCIKELQEKNNA